MAYNLYAHGGGCCGRKVISNVGAMIQGSAGERSFREVSVKSDNSSGGRGLCTEVVLTSRQLAAKPWLGTILAELDYELVQSFRNINSGNICHVFLRSGVAKRSRGGNGRCAGIRAFRAAEKERKAALAAAEA